MATTNIYDYIKFRPHFDTKALLLADTSMAYTTTGNKYRLDENDVVTAGNQHFTVAASGASDNDEVTAGGVKLYLSGPDVSFVVAYSDETTAITTGTAKRTFAMPHAMKLTEVRAFLTTAQTSGDIFTVDINEGGTSILSTKLTIDNTEQTSVTATTAAVISDADLADDAVITIDVDQVGIGTAAGGKIAFIGYLA